MKAKGTPPPEASPYEPKGAALTLFYCKDEEILIEGPAGTGKTRGVLEKIHLMLLKYPGARGLIARKTRTSMTESVLTTFEDHVLPKGDSIKAGAAKRFRQAYEYPNGSHLVVGGMDNADRIMSTEFDVIGIFEATELIEDEHEKLTTRLRNGVIPYQQIIADCNPGAEWHWLNRRAHAGKMTRLLSRHEDNPAVTAKYLEKLAGLSGARKARLFEGRWASEEGLVYDTFDASVHVIDKMPEGWEAWRKYRVVDFGYQNPFVCQWWAEDPDGRLYLYREWYRTKMLVSDHATKIKAFGGKERYAYTVADHDAEDRATLHAEGVQTVAATKTVTLGVQAVQDRMAIQPDGKPRIYFLRTALVERDRELADGKKPCSTLEEIDGYIWPESKEGKEEKEAPVKVNDHGMDAMRYIVAAVDNVTERPRPSFRAL